MTIGEHPLVVVISVTPLLGDAVAAAAPSAVVQRFDSGRGEVPSLLRWTDPDVVVVETDEDALDAELYAMESGRPVIQVAPAFGSVRVLVDGRWDEATGAARSADAFRHVFANAMLGRRLRLVPPPPSASTTGPT